METIRIECYLIRLHLQKHTYEYLTYNYLTNTRLAQNIPCIYNLLYDNK
jgi:hypothetical protein